MEQPARRQRNNARAARELEETHQALLALYDELTETAAWTALVIDGACGILGDAPGDADPAAATGLRLAATWLKQRNHRHASSLHAACERLRRMRGR